MLNAPVLVLNQNYEPLNVCDIRRAFNLLGSEKAELLERNHQVIHTPTLAIPAPSVIRLVYLVRRPRPRVKLSRREVFARDAHACQYCGASSRDLTIDHVMPKHRGGRHEWENLVTACRACNHRKGSKTLAEAPRGAGLDRPGYEIVYHRTYGICYDGDLMEGMSHEAASLAGHLKLGKLIFFYDDNHITIEGSTDLAFTDDVGRRFGSALVAHHYLGSPASRVEFLLPADRRGLDISATRCCD